MKSLAAVFAPLVLAGVAHAANTSVYTSYDLKKCSVLQKATPEEEFGGSFLCQGYGKLKIYFSEGDLRTTIAFGKKPQDHCAASQSFGHFNSVNSTVEWRLKNGKPIAAIHRWYIATGVDGEKDKDWLVVTKLDPENSCHMAVIEGALPNANDKAREVADQMSPSFKCENDEEKIIAQPTTNIEIATSSGSCEKY